MTLVVYLVHLWLQTCKLHVIVGQYPRAGLLFFIVPGIMTLFVASLVMGDFIIVNQMKAEQDIRHVQLQGSFWM